MRSRGARRASKFVYARHHSGALRGYKLGPQFRFRRSDVLSFLEASLGRAGRSAATDASARVGGAGGDLPGAAG